MRCTVIGGCGSSCGPRRSGTPRSPGTGGQLDEQWRSLIRRVVQAGIDAGEIGPVDVDTFALTWAALLDGLAVQVALADEVVTETAAHGRVALAFARRELGLT